MKTGPELRISAAARGFVLLALGGPILWDRDVTSVVALAVLVLSTVIIGYGNYIGQASTAAH